MKKKMYKYTNSKDLFDNFSQAREARDTWGKSEGGRKKKTRRKRGAGGCCSCLNKKKKKSAKYEVATSAERNPLLPNVLLRPVSTIRVPVPRTISTNDLTSLGISKEKETRLRRRTPSPCLFDDPRTLAHGTSDINFALIGFDEHLKNLPAHTGGRRKKKTRKYKGNKYPYKNITKTEAIADFIKLKTTTNPRSLNGLEIVNYGTEKLRVRTKYRGKSLIQRWKDKKARKTLKKFANRLYKGSYTDDLLHAYRSAIALSWGTLSSMRTSAALQMYRKYNAKKVLDFTAGWGSRMTAALAADIDYIGIDTNKSLKKGYNKILKTTKKHTKSKVKLFFKPAETVDYSKLDYDFVFTSPPYEYLELYEHMKNYEGTKKIKQAHSANDKRRKNDGFYDTFLIPTIKEIYKHLPKGKWMCLNVPDLMYDKIKKKWKACNKKEDYMISKRVGSNMKSDDRRGQEFVYCWKKK